MNDQRFEANKATEQAGRADRRGNQLSAVEALEQGFALFRASFAREAWRYYLGAAPLLICLVPLWAVTGQVRVADESLRAGAAVLSAAYLLRVALVGQYVQKVRQHVFGVPATRRSNLSVYLAALGRTIVWKLTLGGLALATLPLLVVCPLFYSASQYATLEAQQDSTERHSLWGCLVLAGQWFSGSVLLLFLLVPLWIAVLLNCLILAVLVPQLLHAIFGVSSLLSTPSGPMILFSSSSFWLALLAGTWSALDPVVKCTYVVVYQHLRSRREGDDLRGLLASLPRGEKNRAAIMGSGRTARLSASMLLLACLFGGSPTMAASGIQANGDSVQDAPPSVDDSMRLERVDRLEKALQEESQRAIYRWHGAESPPRTPGWLGKLLQKVAQAMDRAWQALGKLLRKLWPRRPSWGGGKTGPWRMGHVRLWLVLLAILAASAGAFLLWIRFRRDQAQRTVPIPTLPATGISEVALASDRSEAEWFALAASLQQRGDLRLAFRAAYLGLLAGLAEREWLTIRRDRTNREYLEEFTRRWCRRPRSVATEIPEKLRGSLRRFDRVWYGSHPLTAGSVEAYRRDQWELLRNV